MDLLPVEPISKELELSEMDIMKNRCNLVESQIKILQKMVDDTTTENKMLKDLVEKLYIIVQDLEDTINDSESESDEIEETVAIPLEIKKN
jgi:DNA-binding ferritin-like protein